MFVYFSVSGKCPNNRNEIYGNLSGMIVTVFFWSSIFRSVGCSSPYFSALTQIVQHSITFLPRVPQYLSVYILGFRFSISLSIIINFNKLSRRGVIYSTMPLVFFFFFHTNNLPMPSFSCVLLKTFSFFTLSHHGASYGNTTI